MKKIILSLVCILLLSPNYAMDKKFKYLALGDSYTIGESVPEQERWPVLFAKELRSNGIKVKKPEIIAKTGWTTANLLEAIEKEDPKGPYNLVTLLIGVNNQYQGRDLIEYRKELRELLQTAIHLAGGEKEKVIVLSIPDWGQTPFARERNQKEITKKIAEFNQVKKEECDRCGVFLVDITPVSLQVTEDPKLLAHDGLHYSGKMHQKWVDEISKEIKAGRWTIPTK